MVTDFSTMTDDQLDEWLAVNVMGGNEFFPTTYAIHNGRVWQPTRDLNQAVMCADFMANLGYSWSADNVENDHYHASVYRPSTENIYFCDATNNPARALSEAVCMAVEGEG